MEGARMQTLLIAAALVLSCASWPVVAFSAQPLGLSTNVAARVLRCVPALRMKKEDGEATQVRSPDLCVPAAARATLHTPRADDLLADSHSHRRAPLACPGACPS